VVVVVVVVMMVVVVVGGWVGGSNTSDQLYHIIYIVFSFYLWCMCLYVYVSTHDIVILYVNTWPHGGTKER
jgi:hypothetical protein